MALFKFSRSLDWRQSLWSIDIIHAYIDTNRTYIICSFVSCLRQLDSGELFLSALFALLITSTILMTFKSFRLRERYC